MSPVDGIDFSALAESFRTEAEENLAAMEEALLRLESAPTDPELLHTIFRAAHTLKGGAAILGLDAMVELAHRLEELLERLRQGRFVASAALISLLLRAVDHLRRTAPAAIAGEHDAVLDAALVSSLAAAAESGRCNDAAIAIPVAEATDRQISSLRVPAAQLDAIVNLTGELAVVRGRLRELAERGGDRTVLETQSLLDRLSENLQERVFRLRMVTFGPLLRRCARQLRDLAQAQNKDLRLRTVGEDVEIDAAIADRIRDVLLHTVRNAVDHGIESSSERLAKGKPKFGTVTIEARQDAGMIAVEIRDDGRGLDRDRITAKARAQGLIDASAERLSDAEVNRIVFSPGFSTATEVTDVSGRGVGMDVVQKKITELRGSVTLTSEPGRGTTLSFRLPLTISVIDSLTVRVGNETFVLPLDYVTECIDVEPAALGQEASGLAELRGSTVPFLRLDCALGSVGRQETARSSLVVVRHGGDRVGLVLDELLGRAQVVLKPIDTNIRRHPGLTAATVLGDGSVAFVIDVPRLLQRHFEEAA